MRGLKKNCQLWFNMQLFKTPLQAGVAQLVEQRIRNAKVVGSTPIIGTMKSTTYKTKQNT